MARGRGQNPGSGARAGAPRRDGEAQAPDNLRERMIQITMEWHLWTNEDKTFAICRVHDHTNGQTATAKGPLAHIKVGQAARLHGRWEYEPKKGWSFKAEWSDLTPTEGLDQIKTWVEAKGIDWEPIMLSRVAHAWNGADDALDELEENPYELLRVAPFTEADKLGVAMGLDPEDPRRVAAGAREMLKAEEEEGNTYTTEDRLKKLVSDLLYLPDLDELAADDSLYIEDGRWYRRQARDLEVRVGDGVLRILKHTEGDDSDVVIPEGDFPLTDEQESGVRAAHKYPISIITGGPGVGKTSTLKALVDSLEASGDNYLLAAPTGKAAKRMTESTERPAKTLHSMLDWQYVQGLKDNPGPLDADVIVVDESSMMDLELADKLLSRVKEGTRLVLVGDVDQLPAVGQGNVFHDLIESGAVPTTRLTKTFRQGAGSLLLTNAQRVRDGLEPYWDTESARKDLGDVLEDFEYMPEKNSNTTAKAVIRFADENPDTMVIAPTRHGRCGVHRLNNDFQSHRNAKGEELLEGEVYKIRKGDRILVTQNDRKLGVVNGDLGELVGVTAGMALLKIDGRTDIVEMELPKAEDTLELGYVLTIHKSQGSQASQVVCPLQEGSADHMLNRNLIYTAWTRGQGKCVVIGPKSAITKALPRKGSDRNTDLGRYLKENAE